MCNIPTCYRTSSQKSANLGQASPARRHAGLYDVTSSYVEGQCYIGSESTFLSDQFPYHRSGLLIFVLGIGSGNCDRRNAFGPGCASRNPHES